jgi:hypothetical protein
LSLVPRYRCRFRRPRQGPGHLIFRGPVQRPPPRKHQGFCTQNSSTPPSQPFTSPHRPHCDPPSVTQVWIIEDALSAAQLVLACPRCGPGMPTLLYSNVSVRRSFAFSSYIIFFPSCTSHYLDAAVPASRAFFIVCSPRRPFSTALLSWSQDHWRITWSPRLLPTLLNPRSLPFFASLSSSLPFETSIRRLLFVRAACTTTTMC